MTLKLTNNQIELIVEYIDARIEHKIDGILGRDSSYSWMAVSDVARELEKEFELKDFTIPS